MKYVVNLKEMQMFVSFLLCRVGEFICKVVHLLYCIVLNNIALYCIELYCIVFVVLY